MPLNHRNKQTCGWIQSDSHRCNWHSSKGYFVIDRRELGQDFILSSQILVFLPPTGQSPPSATPAAAAGGSYSSSPLKRTTVDADAER